MATVNEVAEELGLTSREVLARLERLGRPASTYTSPVDESALDALRAGLGDGGRPASGAEVDAALEQPPPQRVRAEDLAGPPAGEAAEVPPETPGEPPRAPAPPKRSEDSHARKLMRQVLELPLLILIAFGIAVVIKTFLVQAFFIPSGSMRPTLKSGNRVLVEKLSFRFGDPEPGQVVVFAKTVLPGRQPDLPWPQDLRNLVREVLGLPTGREEDYIKRIVAVGGDSFSYTGSPRRLVVNGERVREPYLQRGDRFSAQVTSSNCRSMNLIPADDACRVPAGRVFVMGDNRAKSMDSRVLGPIRDDHLVGRGFVIIWPLRDFGGL